MEDLSSDTLVSLLLETCARSSPGLDLFTEVSNAVIDRVSDVSWFTKAVLVLGEAPGRAEMLQSLLARTYSDMYVLRWRDVEPLFTPTSQPYTDILSADGRIFEDEDPEGMARCLEKAIRFRHLNILYLVLRFEKYDLIFSRILGSESGSGLCEGFLTTMFTNWRGTDALFDRLCAFCDPFANDLALVKTLINDTGNHTSILFRLHNLYARRNPMLAPPRVPPFTVFDRVLLREWWMEHVRWSSIREAWIARTLKL